MHSELACVKIVWKPTEAKAEIYAQVTSCSNQWTVKSQVGHLCGANIIARYSWKSENASICKQLQNSFERKDDFNNSRLTIAH